MHLRNKQTIVKTVNAPNCHCEERSDVAISGRQLQFVQGVNKMHGPIASVAALTAQPLAALPPYGCGVPLAGSERLAGWQYLRHGFNGMRLPGLSLRGPNGAVAISGRQLRFRRGFPVIHSGTARLPRRFAPRNDKLGSLVSMNLCRKICKCTRRSLSAATVKFDSDCVRRPIAASRTGRAVPSHTTHDIISANTHNK